MTDHNTSINIRKVNIEKIKVLKKNTMAVNKKVHVATKAATLKIKQVHQTVVTSKPVQNVKKETSSMGKSYDEIKAALQAYASSGALNNSHGEKEDRKSVV